jgi:hypothetical protein
MLSVEYRECVPFDREITLRCNSGSKANGCVIGSVVWIVCAAALAGSGAPVDAQSGSQPSARAWFFAGGSVGDGGPALALSAGLGLQVDSRVSVEFELAYARRLKFVLERCPPPLVCVLAEELPVTGRTLALVPQVLVELVGHPRAVRAYLTAGAGAGHVRQRYFVGPSASSSFVEPAEFTRSKIVPTVAFGGGAEIAIARRLAWGVDVRSLQFFDETLVGELSIVPSGRLTALRLGTHVAWRF